MRSVALLLLLCAAAFQAAGAATITVENKCSYTIWAAASPGGGQQLDGGQTWSFGVAAGTTQARVWGRTGCNFDASGHGSCQTGDCNGQLKCSGYGTPPATLAEYALNQYQNLDFYDISLVDGFNVPLSMYPSGSGCKAIDCNKDINSICPSELRVPGACASACTKFHDDKYCCTGSAANNCGPTDYSRIFKNQCPQAYSYPKDDQTSTFTCPAGGDYRVVFCG